MEKQSEKKLLKREALRQSLRRLEDAARTPEDFNNVIEWWNKLEANEQRRLRNHEVSRGDIPLEWQMADDAMLFPTSLNIFARQMLQGNFDEIIFNCPYELHELVEDKQISGLLQKLNINRKEILYYSTVRLYSAGPIAKLRQQTERNIRKIRFQTIQYLRRKLNIEVPNE